MKTKVDIVSGFLGAGKTSLIRKLIADRLEIEKIVVIENELGKVGIDGELLKGGSIQVRELGSGCICCSIAGNLIMSLSEIIDEFSPSRIIIEPSGVAQLSDLLRIFEFSEVKDITELNMIITVVDASKFHLHRAFAETFVGDQIKFANTLIMSKTEGVDDARIEDIVIDLSSINSKANIITTDWQKLHVRQIMDTAEKDHRVSLKDQLAMEESAHSHHVHGPGCCCGCSDNPYHYSAEEVFESWEAITSKKYSKESLDHIFNELMDKDKYGTILRGKGILECSHGGWIHFDYVPYELKTEDYTISCSGMICVIGIGLNKHLISELFNNV